MAIVTRIGIASLVAVAALVVVSAMGFERSQDRGELTAGDVAARGDAAILGQATQTRVFFGHQSVGGNILDGVPSAFRAVGVAAPRVVEVEAGSPDPTAALPAGGEGFIAHALIGENGDPSGKLQDFDALLRSGLAENVDAAMMKFCYLDVTSVTDVDELFAEYVGTLSALERDFPDVTFLHVTTPVTTAPGLKTKVKALLGRGITSDGDNAARERLNALMRETYGGDRLFDLAAIESTAPDGSRVSGTHDGQRFYALYDGYALDDGHLNPLASQLAADLWLTTIERAGE